MLTTATWRREVFVLFGAVLLRAVCAAVLHCSFPLGELEPLHKVGRSGSRFIMCGAVRLRAVRKVSHNCLCTLRELEPLHKEPVYIFCVTFLLLYCCRWNILMTRKWAVHGIASCEPYSAHLKYYQCNRAFALWMNKLSFENNEQCD